MGLEKLVVGQLATNCYIPYDGKSRHAIIIDPGDDADYIFRKIQDLKLKPKFIVATHGHFDHILAVTELKLAFNIPFLIHQADLFLVKQAQKSAKHFLGINVDPVALPDGFLSEGQKIEMGNERLQVLETPGHTPGGICLYSAHPGGENVLFTGDTIFAEGVGRTDFSYSSSEDLSRSIEKLIKQFNGSIAYSGHGDEFRIKKPERVSY